MDSVNSQSGWRSRDVWLATLVLLLGGGLVVRYATLELGSDDVSWLHGQSPTNLDNYRHIPRLFFGVLRAVWGESALAALAMSFTFHALNTWLLARLTLELIGRRSAAWAAATVFMVNPLTLFTLTWISCFSYIIGGTFCLLSVSGFYRIGRASGWAVRTAWAAASVLSYGLGLLCCHEMLFLPVVFVALALLERTPSPAWRGIAIAAAALLAVAINAWLYDFSRYGIRASKLFEWDFVSAAVSSSVSFGAALALAYPLSFVFRTGELLRHCFESPGRWIATLLIVIVAVGLVEQRRFRRPALALGLALAALTMPYVIRLYLMPDTASYHISYVLSGRVFYLPFLAISIGLGAMAAFWIRSVLIRPLAVAACPCAYLYALLGVYSKADFVGLQVVAGAPPVTQASTWTPYATPPTAWPMIILLVIGFLMIRSKQIPFKQEPGRNYQTTSSLQP